MKPGDWHKGFQTGLKAAFVLMLALGAGLVFIEGPIHQTCAVSAPSKTTAMRVWCGIASLFDRSDTIAQWAMMVFTAIAAWFLYLTLQATRKMADEARAAAQDQIQQTQKMMDQERGLRREENQAYVYVEKAEFYWGNKNMSDPHMRFWVANCGATPAAWYKIRFDVKAVQYEPAEDPLAVQYQEVGLVAHGPWMGLSPGVDQARRSTFPLTDEQKAMAGQAYNAQPFIKRPTHMFLVWGDVVYQTIQGERFITPFAFARRSLPDY